MDTAKPSKTVTSQPKRSVNQDMERVSETLCKLNRQYYEGHSALLNIDKLVNSVEDLGKQFESQLRQKMETTLRNVKKVVDKEKRKLKPALIRLGENQSSLKKTAEKLHKDGYLTGTDVAKMRKRIRKAEDSLVSIEKNVLNTTIEFVPDSGVKKVRDILEHIDKFGDVIVSSTDQTQSTRRSRAVGQKSTPIRASRSVFDLRLKKSPPKRSSSAEVRLSRETTVFEDSDSDSSTSLKSSSSEDLAAAIYETENDKYGKKPDEDVISTGSGYIVVSCGAIFNNSKDSVKDLESPSIDISSSHNTDTRIHGNPSITEPKLAFSADENDVVAKDTQCNVDVIAPVESIHNSEPSTEQLDESTAAYTEEATDVKTVLNTDTDNQCLPFNDSSTDAESLTTLQANTATTHRPKIQEVSVASPTQSVNEWSPDAGGRQSPLGSSFSKEEIEALQQCSLKGPVDDTPSLTTMDTKEAQGSLQLVDYEEEPKAFGKEFLLNRYKIQQVKPTELNTISTPEQPEQDQTSDVVTSKSTDFKTDEIPCNSKTDELPSSTITDGIPSNSKTDELPSSSKTDAIPSSSKTDAIPSNSKTDAIPSSSKTDAIPSNSKPTGTRGDNTTLVSTETQTVDMLLQGYEDCSQSYPKSILKKAIPFYRAESFDDRRARNSSLSKSVSFTDVHELREKELASPFRTPSHQAFRLGKLAPSWTRDLLSSDSDSDSYDEETTTSDNDRVLYTVDCLPDRFDFETNSQTKTNNPDEDEDVGQDNKMARLVEDTQTAELPVQTNDETQTSQKADRSKLHLANLPAHVSNGPSTVTAQTETAEKCASMPKVARPEPQSKQHTHPTLKNEIADRFSGTVLQAVSKESQFKNVNSLNEDNSIGSHLNHNESGTANANDTSQIEQTDDRMSCRNTNDSYRVTQSSPDARQRPGHVKAAESEPTKSSSIQLSEKPQLSATSKTKPPLPATKEGHPASGRAISARFRKPNKLEVPVSPAVTRERPISPSLRQLLPEAVRTRLNKRQSETAKVTAYTLDRQRLKSGPSVQERAAVFKEFIRTREEGTTSPSQLKHQPPQETNVLKNGDAKSDSSNRSRSSDESSNTTPEKPKATLLTRALKKEGERIRTSTEKLLSNVQRKSSFHQPKKSEGPSFFATRFRSRSTSPSVNRDADVDPESAQEQEPNENGCHPSTGMDLQNICEADSSRVIRKEFFIRQKRSLSATPLRRQQSVTKPLFTFSNSFKLPLRDKACRPCGVAIVDNGMVIVVDEESRNIHLFTSNYSHLDSLVTSDTPGQVCSMGRFSVAVSFPYKQKIQLFDVFHKVRKERELCVNCSEWVVDICYRKGHIFALCKAGHIHIVDERGREIKKIDCGVTGQIEVNHSADRIVINEQGRITCFNMNGKTMWTESKPHTRGVVCYNDGVYVLDPIRNKLTSVFFNELITADLVNEELESPYAVSLASGGDKLLVTQYTEGMDSAKTRTVKVFVLDKS